MHGQCRFEVGNTAPSLRQPAPGRLTEAPDRRLVGNRVPVIKAKKAPEGAPGYDPVGESTQHRQHRIGDCDKAHELGCARRKGVAAAGTFALRAVANPQPSPIP